MANSSPSSVNKHISETSSRCRTECVTTAHNFEVTEYSLLEGMGIGKFVSSSTFSVGGYNWNIRIYPDGRKEEDKAAYMSAFLSTCSNPTTGVQMKNTFSLLEKDGKVTCLYSDTRTFRSGSWGWPKYIVWTTRYSASALERDTVAWRLEDQEMRESPRCAVDSRELAVRVNRRGQWLAGRHVGALEQLLSIFLLGEEEAVCRAGDGDPEEVVEGAEVLHGELAGELALQLLKKRRQRGCEDDVVYVEEEVGVTRAAMEHEQRGICARADEAELVREGREPGEPRTRCLFEAVQRLVEEAHVLGVVRVDETRRLLTVDSLGETPVEKGVVDVHLMDRPVARGSNGEDDADRGGLDDGRERLVEVHARSLGEPAQYPACFVPFERPVRLELVAEEPFAGDDIDAGWPWHEPPVMVWVGMGATRRRGRGGVGNDDCITIRCVLTVMKEPRTEDVSTVMVQVPQSDLQTHFTNMLNHGEGMDVTFMIDSRTLRAHRCVLAARSLVFKAELFGQMKETTKRRVKINDMEPAIFEALLPFIYTDSWPSNCDLDQNAELQHLLVAADRYGLERLKIICEGKLCQKIDVQTVATTLALAEQHDATQLKNACLRYLSSQEVLRAVKETDGFKHLTASCPWIMMDILERVAPPQGMVASSALKQ
ncbi:BTB/POZ and MATH domain-containing protein 2-like [Triticum aestivum]|uniref:BTB/POZ and MATH domain-containing protein 2-like n=1 Tax=Triticum aestivum TaxID=4565 RepID=UPI001D001E0E|nr:BTB/POZ and MATH domain-containing protein 2-like [Triticum aestivum]